MTYKHGLFIEREPGRRPIRDRYRAKFFADLGLTPNRDPLAHDPDPKAQFETVNALIDKAEALQTDGTDVVRFMRTELSALMIGIPVMGSGLVGRPSFPTQRLSLSLAGYFLEPWGNKTLG